MSYQKDGKWQHTTSLGPKDVLVAAKLLELAGAYMIEKDTTNPPRKLPETRPVRSAADVLDETEAHADGPDDEGTPF